MRGESGHVAPWWAVALGVALGWLLLVPVGLLLAWLDGPRFDSVDTDDMRPVIGELEMLGGIPMDTDARAAVLLRHPNGPEAGIAAARRNAESAGWELLDSAAIGPGACAFFDDLAAYLAAAEDPELIRGLLGDTPHDGIFVVSFTTVC